MDCEVYICYAKKYSSILKRSNWYSDEKRVDAVFIVVLEPRSLSGPSK